MLQTIVGVVEVVDRRSRVFAHSWNLMQLLAAWFARAVLLSTVSFAAIAGALLLSAVCVLGLCRLVVAVSYW